MSQESKTPLQLWGEISNAVYRGEITPEQGNRRVLEEVRLTQAEKAAMALFSMNHRFLTEDLKRIRAGNFER